MFQIPLIYYFIMGYFILMLSYELITHYHRLILPMSLAYQSEVAAPCSYNVCIAYTPILKPETKIFAKELSSQVVTG